MLAHIEDKERLTCKHKTGLEIPISLGPQGTKLFSVTLPPPRFKGTEAHVIDGVLICLCLKHIVIRTKVINA